MIATREPRYFLTRCAANKRQPPAPGVAATLACCVDGRHGHTAFSTADTAADDGHGPASQLWLVADRDAHEEAEGEAIKSSDGDAVAWDRTVRLCRGRARFDCTGAWSGSSEPSRSCFLFLSAYVESKQ